MVSAERIPGKPDVKAALLGGLVVASLFLVAALRGTLGEIGPDNDDVMRLLQIQDFLNGQGWFDVSQARLGLDGGTLMHWSRIADIPVLVLTGIFGLFLPADTALVWAYTTWPPISVLLVMWGVYTGASHVAGKQAALGCLGLAAILLAWHFRFLPGAIDHHNLQLGLLALALGLMLDPHRRAGRMAGAGLALALSVAVGAETYFFVAVFCAFAALDWAIAGEAARKGTLGFGAGLAAGLEIAFFSTVSPRDYQMVACDTLSSITLLAGVAGGLGLAAAASLASKRDIRLRFAALGAVGLVCGGVLAGYGPQCLSNPLSELSPTVKTFWLDKVNEAQPVLSSSPTFFHDVPYRLGIILLALGLTGYGLYRRDWSRLGLLSFPLLLVALLLTLDQTRFYAFGHLFAIIPLGLWVGRIHAEGKRRDQGHVAYIGALALSLPIVWGMPGHFLAPKVAEGAMIADSDMCLDEALLAELNTLPPGRILAPADFSPSILVNTRHSVLHGNYHRNHEGISAAIDLFLAHPDETAPKLAAAGVDYVLACPFAPETILLSGHDEDGFAARLKRGDVPEFLAPGATQPAGQSATRVYRVFLPAGMMKADDGIS